MKKKQEYTCALCKGTFFKGRSDEEAWAEHLERNPEVPVEETSVICDNCFQNIMAVEEERACPIKRRE